MAREKKAVHKVQMTDGKRNIIQQLLQEYDIQSAPHSKIVNPDGNSTIKSLSTLTQTKSEV